MTSIYDVPMSERTHVMMTEQYGRGVFAYHDLPAGAWVEAAEILVLSASDTAIINTTALRDYLFTYDRDSDCLVMGIGEMFNHDDNANVAYHIEHLNGRAKMVFTALRDIKKGEQLFINYAADLRPDEPKQAYVNNLV